MCLRFFRQYYKIVDITKSYGFFFPFGQGHYFLGMFTPTFISHPLF